MIEEISADDEILGYVLKNPQLPNKSTFLTSPDLSLQLGYIVYPANGQVKRHFHNTATRTITNCSEVLILKKGRCLVDFYDRNLKLVTTRELVAGDIALILGRGHGIKMLEDTVFLEIKQGPYLDNDKSFF